jgi:hypothetical protein
VAGRANFGRVEKNSCFFHARLYNPDVFSLTGILKNPNKALFKRADRDFFAF